jgi:hypothetical protein
MVKWWALIEREGENKACWMKNLLQELQGAWELARIEPGLDRDNLVGINSFGGGSPAEPCATLGRKESAHSAKGKRAVTC